MLPLLLIGVVALVLVGSGGAAHASEYVKKIVTGSPKTLVTYTLVNNRVVESPAVLWAAAQKKAGFNFPFRVFLLASMAASEYSSGSQQLKAAVIWAARNYEKARKTTLTAMLAPDGKLGGQLGRYASTAHPPTLTDVKLAMLIEAGKLPDMTRGSIQFDSVRTQRILNKRDPVKNKPPEIIAANRMKEGKRALYLPGEDPENARFWQPTSVAV
jgi:hypothetical protein